MLIGCSNILGWRHLLSLKHMTYEKVTLEFLSFVTFEYGRRVRGHFGSIFFRLFNRDFLFN